MTIFIPDFWCGVIFTILSEFTAIIVVCILIYYNNKGK